MPKLSWMPQVPTNVSPLPRAHASARPSPRTAPIARAEAESLHLCEGSHGEVPAIRVPPSHQAVPGEPAPEAYFRRPQPDFPKVLEVPAGVEASPASWGRAARPYLDQALAETPAVIVRGAPLRQPSDFRAFLDGVDYERDPYVGSFIDRAVEDGLYDATANPSWYMLTPHNENVFFSKMPRKIIFSMVQPATGGGGETMLQTNEGLTLTMGQELIDRFTERGGIRYTRWYPSPAQKMARLSDLKSALEAAKASGDEQAAKFAELQLLTAKTMPTWQSWVGSEDPEAARTYFEDLDLSVRFDAEDGLVAWNVLPATVSGPKGRPMWLNFADYGGIPPYFTVAYGDGTPIETDVQRDIQRRVLADCTALALRQGDVIFFDNIHCQHGRTPFRGKRKLLVELTA